MDRRDGPTAITRFSWADSWAFVPGAGAAVQEAPPPAFGRLPPEGAFLARGPGRDGGILPPQFRLGQRKLPAYAQQRHAWRSIQ